MGNVKTENGKPKIVNGNVKTENRGGNTFQFSVFSFNLQPS